MRLGLGHAEGLPDVEAIPYQETFYILAPSFEWTNVDGNGKSYVTPVRNQLACGSCWAFAATAALESYILMVQDMPNTNLDLSEQILVSCYIQTDAAEVHLPVHLLISKRPDAPRVVFPLRGA